MSLRPLESNEPAAAPTAAATDGVPGLPESPYTDRQARFMVRRLAALVLLWPLQAILVAVGLWRLAGDISISWPLVLVCLGASGALCWVLRAHLGLLAGHRQGLHKRCRQALALAALAAAGAYLGARGLEDPVLAIALWLQAATAISSLAITVSLERCGLLPPALPLRQGLLDWEQQSAQAMRLRRQAQKAQKAAAKRAA